WTRNKSGKDCKAAMWKRPMPTPTIPTRNCSFMVQISQSLRVGFCLQRKLRRQETMGLWHGCLRAVQNIGDQLPSIRQLLLAAIQILDAFLIDQEKMIGPSSPRYVDVFPQFDIPFRSQNRQATIPPGT